MQSKHRKVDLLYPNQIVRFWRLTNMDETQDLNVDVILYLVVLTGIVLNDKYTKTLLFSWCYVEK